MNNLREWIEENRKLLEQIQRFQEDFPSDRSAKLEYASLKKHEAEMLNERHS